MRIRDVSTHGVAQRPRRMATAIFLLKVARPGFWLTSIWFYMLPLGQRYVWNRPAFWLGIIYVCLPLGLLIYGANDIVDAENDRRNPRKDTFLFGARGTPAQLAMLPTWIAAVQASFAVIFLMLIGPKVLLWFGLLIFATLIYNWPPPGLKGRPPCDLLNQLGYLLVFVLSCWLNRVPSPPWPTFVFGALFAMHSLLFGEIMDLEPDRLAGRRTTAGLLGLVPSKFLAAGFLAIESTLIAICVRDFYLAGFLILSAGAFVLDATLLWRERLYNAAEMRLFLLAWNAVALVSIPWVWFTATLARLP